MADGTPIGTDFAWLDKVMAEAIENIAHLTDFEGDFASTTAGRLGKYRERTLMSVKQLAIAKRIERKLRALDDPSTGSG